MSREIYTDGATGYDSLKTQDYIHETVNHVEEYVRGQFTLRELIISGVF